MTEHGTQKFEVRPASREHLPGMYRCADDASRKGQRWYLAWVGANLVVLVLGGIGGAIRSDDSQLMQATSFAAAALFFAGLGISLLLAFERWDRIWYAGRAVAESVKSLAWKFSTGAEPFPIALAEKEAREMFLESLTELMSEYKELSAAMAGPESCGNQITEFMLGLRCAPTPVRRDVYLSQRVHEQQGWYAEKAESNHRAQRAWFIGFLGAQVLACVTTLIGAIKPEWGWHLSGVFGALATALIAWIQVKRFQELAQAYGYAAQELSIIGERGRVASTADELSRFISDAETAISREHTAWVARREVH